MDTLVALFYMVRDRNQLFLILIGGLILTSCQRKPEAELVHLLKNKYSNLHVNGHGNKEKAIDELAQYLNNHPLNDENIQEISKKLHKINDGHVVFFDSRAQNNQEFTSGVKFYKGSSYIESCAECTPVLAKEKYSIVAINNAPVEKYYYDNHDLVSASTQWGREFKLLRLIAVSKHPEVKKITLRDSKQKIYNVILNWKSMDKDFHNECISSQRVSDNFVKIDINNLWCDLGDGSSPRLQLIKNFEDQWQKAISLVKKNDSILLDLRENGGGGDEEVEYVLNTFLNKSVELYKYQFLKKTDPIRLNRLSHLIQFGSQLWSESEYMFTNLEKAPGYKLFNNKLTIMTSAGCFSSCEAIVSVLKNQKRAFVVGSKTHGGAGAPEEYKLHNSPYSVGLPSCLTWQENGLLYEGVGVYPDIDINQRPETPEDSVLQKAIDLTLSRN